MFKKAALCHILGQVKPQTTNKPSAAAIVTKPLPQPQSSEVVQHDLTTSIPAVTSPQRNPSPIDSSRIPRNVVSNNEVKVLLSKLVNETPPKCTIFDEIKDKTYYLDNVKSVKKPSQPRSASFSAKIARQAGLLKCPKSISTTDALSLYSIWNQYTRSLLAGSPDSQWDSKVLTMDWHGAPFTVERSRTTSLIGKSGFVIQETCNVIRLALYSEKSSENLRIIQIPKFGTIFSVVISSSIFRIFGENIVCRSGERSVKKFKNMRNTIL
ncbi:hypothetical protein RCL1_006872 [Eukaryota sp. TZLM3-RCL]